MRSKNIFEALLYSNVFMRYEEFCERLQRRVFRAFMTLQQDVSKASRIAWQIFVHY